MKLNNSKTLVWVSCVEQRIPKGEIPIRQAIWTYCDTVIDFTPEEIFLKQPICL